MIQKTGRAKQWTENFESLNEFYAAAYPSAIQAAERLPVLGTELLCARQGPGDWSGAPLPMLSLIRTDSSSRRACIDVGGGRFNSDFRNHDLLIVAPGSHAAIEAFEPHSITVLSVPYTAALEAYPELPLPLDGDFGDCHSGPVSDRLMSATIARIAAQARLSGLGETLFFDAAITFIMSLMCTLKAPECRQGSSGRLAPWQVRRVKNYLLDRLAEPTTLAELASVARLSPFHFARAFKRSTGYAPYQYQLRLRLEKAKELLEAGDLSVTDVALAVGYATSQSFARMFRGQTGVSPVQWRRICSRG